MRKSAKELGSLVIALLAVGGTLVSLSGCAVGKHSVVAATGTYLGVEVGQHPVNRTPNIKVGYGRAELAIVPTNRDDLKKPGVRLAIVLEQILKHAEGLKDPAAKKDAMDIRLALENLNKIDGVKNGEDIKKIEKALEAGKLTTSSLCCLIKELSNSSLSFTKDGQYTQSGITDGGAVDSAEVLMEIQFGGSTSSPSGTTGEAKVEGGLYQRLAVGKIAVQQPGAVALLIRNGQGVPDAQALKALQVAPKLRGARIDAFLDLLDNIYKQLRQLGDDKDLSALSLANKLDKSVLVEESKSALKGNVFYKEGSTENNRTTLVKGKGIDEKGQFFSKYHKLRDNDSAPQGFLYVTTYRKYLKDSVEALNSAINKIETDKTHTVEIKDETNDPAVLLKKLSAALDEHVAISKRLLDDLRSDPNVNEVIEKALTQLQQ